MRPALLMMTAMTLWVVVEIVGSVATRDMPIAELVWLRYVFHLLFMLIVLAPRFGIGYLRTRRPWLQLGRSLLMVIMPGSFVLGIRTMSSGEIMSVFWIAPVMVPWLALAIGERARMPTWAAVVLGWVGAALTYRLASRTFGANVVLPLAMAGSFAIYVVVTRVLDRSEAVLTNLFYTALGVVLVLTPLMAFVWQRPSLTALAASCAVGVIGWFTLWTLDLSLRAAPASWSAPFMFFQVVVTEAVRMLGLHALPRPSQLAGLVLIGAALVIAAWARTDRSPS
jgi:drug/metabolite transporter (DMT)-like permease